MKMMRKNFVDSVVAEYGKIDAAILTVGGFAMGKNRRYKNC